MAAEGPAELAHRAAIIGNASWAEQGADGE